jgi:cellulose synthase/poly-beta-1,6-N-acetylglucosamine synthase-like glycosyltransferase
MHPYVVVATKGRPRETRRLLDHLERQTLAPRFTVVVGAETTDLAGIEGHATVADERGACVLAPRAGLTTQRNYGLGVLEQKGLFAARREPFFCAFFDDDFRPADDWLEMAAQRFRRGGAVGLTGCVLADGIKKCGLAEDDAAAFLAGQRLPEPHWASGANERELGSTYGCNMAFVDGVVRSVRFDENLPLYGWQEDRDYTGLASALGRVIYFPLCRGVHLGVRAGRVSGFKFGYSQIANPVYLMRKGTVRFAPGFRLLSRALGANLVYSVVGPKHTDYPGRLKGNLDALWDLVRLRSHPQNILREQGVAVARPGDSRGVACR